MSSTAHSSLKYAVKGTAILLTSSSGGVLLWFFSKLIIVKGITNDEFGLYSIALGVVSLVSLIATLGLYEGIARYMAIYLSKGQDEDAKAISRAAVNIGFFSGAIASSLLFLLSGPISAHIFYKPELAPVLKAISFYVFFSVLYTVFAGILCGAKKVSIKAYFIDFGQPFAFIILLIALAYAGFSFIRVPYAYLAASFIVCLSILLYGTLKGGLAQYFFGPGRHSLELVKFSLPLLTISVIGIVLTWTDTLMLGRYATATDVGVYNIASSLVRLVPFPMNALSFVFLPIAGAMFASQEMDGLKRIYQVLTKWIFSASLPILFILFFFPEMTITFLFGQNYIDASLPLQLLCIGYLVHVFVGPNSMLMMVFGHAKTIMNISTAGIVINIVLNYILIKRLGMGLNGAAIATAASYCFNNIVISYLLYRRTGVHPITWSHIRPIIGSAAVAAAIYALAKSLPLYFWMMPLYLAIFLIGYLLVLFASKSVDREDVEMLETIANKFGLGNGRWLVLVRKLARVNS